MLGKASMIELGGRDGLPFRFRISAGGSQESLARLAGLAAHPPGRVAIVAAGLAAFAIGTETWGSIICPSAYSRCEWPTPTYRPRQPLRCDGARAFHGQDRPDGRSAEDCARIFAARLPVTHEGSRNAFPSIKALSLHFPSMELRSAR